MLAKLNVRKLACTARENVLSTQNVNQPKLQTKKPLPSGFFMPAIFEFQPYKQPEMGLPPLDDLALF
jgi:hypothetical protein